MWSHKPCEVCNRPLSKHNTIMSIDKQINGEIKNLHVCYSCWVKHLDDTRKGEKHDPT